MPGTDKRHLSLCPFDAPLVGRNGLDFTSTRSLGENVIKSRNLSPFLSPSAFKQGRTNSFMED
jgi:hypothetical protein